MALPLRNNKMIDLTPVECRRLAYLLSLSESMELASTHYQLETLTKLIAWLRTQQDRPE